MHLLVVCSNSAINILKNNENEKHLQGSAIIKQFETTCKLLVLLVNRGFAISMFFFSKLFCYIWLTVVVDVLDIYTVNALF